MNRGEPSRGKWSKRRIALGTSAGAITVGVLIALIPPLIERSANKLHIALTGPPVPLTVVAHLFDPGNSCEGGLGWVFATTSAELPMPTITSESSAASWALANKGIPASGNYVEATIQATDSTAVVVTGLEVEVLRRRPAPHGVYPSLGGGCGGLTPDFYKANLDAHPPRITESAGQIMIKSSVRSVQPIPFPHRISDTEPEVWHIQATTNTCDCEWIGRIHWTSEGQEGTIPLTEHGRPFRAAAITHTTHLDPGQHGWETFDP